MQSNVELRPNFTYSPLWLWLGIAGVVLIVAWLVFVFVLTRKRTPKSLATLPPREYQPPDLTVLKQKYLALIAEVGVKHANGEYTARYSYQALSKLVRLFVYEINHHRVDVMTLSDLRRSHYPALTQVIEQYYVPEFHRDSAGNVDTAVQAATEVVSTWN
jgi:hypothetical protein